MHRSNVRYPLSKSADGLDAELGQRQAIFLLLLQELCLQLLSVVLCSTGRKKSLVCICQHLHTHSAGHINMRITHIISRQSHLF